MIEHRATKPLERHTLLVQHDEDQRPRFLARARRRRAGRERSWWRNCARNCASSQSTHFVRTARGVAADLRVNLPRYSRASLYV